MRNDNDLQSKRTNKSLGYGRGKASLVLSWDRFRIGVFGYHSSSPTEQQMLHHSHRAHQIAERKPSILNFDMY